MDKETLSNYGWIVICVLVLAVMIALAGPFGTFVANAVKSTTAGLFGVNQNALDAAGIVIGDQEFQCDHNYDGGKCTSCGTVDPNHTHTYPATGLTAKCEICAEVKEHTCDYDSNNTCKMCGEEKVILYNITIGGINYQTRANMTWREWVDSEYNTDGFVLEDAIYYTGDMYVLVVNAEKTQYVTERIRGYANPDYIVTYGTDYPERGVSYDLSSSYWTIIACDHEYEDSICKLCGFVDPNHAHTYPATGLTAKCEKCGEIKDHTCDYDVYNICKKCGAQKEGAVVFYDITIGGADYKTPANMTWREWIDSEYNTGGFVLAEAKYYTGDIRVLVVNADKTQYVTDTYRGYANPDSKVTYGTDYPERGVSYNLSSSYYTIIK